MRKALDNFKILCYFNRANKSFPVDSKSPKRDKTEMLLAEVKAVKSFYNLLKAFLRLKKVFLYHTNSKKEAKIERKS